MKMKKIVVRTSLVFAGVVLCGLAGCSSHPTAAEVAAPGSAPPAGSPVATVTIETKQVASEQKADYVTEIQFRKKQKNMSMANQQKIKKLLADAFKDGRLEEIKVITWADAEYPSIHTKKLSDEERTLAKNRNRAVQDYIHQQNADIQVKTYSMAERPNALKDFVNSSEARIKKSLEVAGIPTTDTSVKMPSKASTAIIMAIMK